MQPTTRFFISVIIPAYNESDSVPRVVLDHVRVLEKNPHVSQWEIVCLDDASTDETRDILRRLSDQIHRLRVIRHDTNRGIQESFHRLSHEARGDLIYQTAADGQWPARNLELLLETLVAGHYDLVIGVRQNRRQIYGWWRRLLSYGFNWSSQVVFKVKTVDANSIKMGTKQVFTIPLISRSFFAEVERIVKASRMGFRIGFQPIEFLPRTEGKASGAKWKNIFFTVLDMVSFALSGGHHGKK